MGSLQIAYSDDALLANKVDGQRLTPPNWPLILTGADVIVPFRLTNIIRIVLTGIS
ncbi:MAG: hypothetical protein Q6361_01465 [Candidatus Hermodarchaeota archaeon]|nr:hypothetical protein [Candidatus Hermodarchaeota archaeon]